MGVRMPEEVDKLGMAKEWEPPAETPAEEKPPTPQAAPTEFVREIDLGLGEGKQVFKAESYEALVDKLVEAQTNATRKIRELSTARPERKRQPEAKSSDYQELKPGALKAEDVLQFQNNPAEMFRRIFQAEMGMSPQELVVRENERRRQDAEMLAQKQFVEEHAQEYTPTPENAQKIMRLLQREKLPISKANLDYAFDELRGELSAVKPQEKNVAPPLAEPQPSSPAPKQASSPPSFVRPSLGGRAAEESSGGIDVTSAEFARIAQLPPAEMKARIEQIFRSSRTAR